MSRRFTSDDDIVPSTTHATAQLHTQLKLKSGILINGQIYFDYNGDDYYFTFEDGYFRTIHGDIVDLPTVVLLRLLDSISARFLTVAQR